MDSDDASQQTRFAGVKKQQKAGQQEADGMADAAASGGETAANSKPSPRHSKKRRSSTRAGGAKNVAGLSELVEVDEEESGSSDNEEAKE